MLKRLGSWERRLATYVPDLSQTEVFIKRAALALLAGQAILCLGAIVTRVMLHGDGSYFAYAIALGEPWSFKWNEIATRASTYVLTVLPAAFISDVFSLSGEQIAAVNGLTFYGVQWVQYLIVVILAWRHCPRLLIFPILQYGLSTGLGFGFPSEIYLAPGFLWICLFALIRNPVPWPVVYAAFAGLSFSHELAIPSALLVLVFSWLRQRPLPAQRLNALLFACFAIVVLALWLVVKLNGGGRGAESGEIYVFDPRRVFGSPTLWIIATAIVAVGATAGTNISKQRHFLWLVGLACVLLTAVASLVFDLVEGRYGSARTLVAACMFLLGLGFVYAADEFQRERYRHGNSPGALSLKGALIAVLCINLASSAIFLHEWNKAITIFSAAVNAETPTGKIDIVSDDQLRTLLGPDGSDLNERMGFSWTWPYRSIVVAKDFRPTHVIIDPEEALGQCSMLSMHPSASRIPGDVIEAVSRYACAQPAPPDRRYLRQWILNLWSSISAEKTH